MKKYLVCLIILSFAASAWATGSCVYTSSETYGNPTRFQKKEIVLTCTSDGSGIAAFSFVPATYGVAGWYLYNVTTDPDGTSAPTSGYDITCVTSGEDICGGLLADRSNTATQTVVIAPTTIGYHMTTGTVVLTFANITSNPGIFVMRIRFSEN